MKLKVKTTILQGLLSKAIKGASLNRLIPLSNMVCINKTGNKLILTTTHNEDSYLYVIANNIEGDDFYVTLEIEQLYKLVSKMSCENITLEMDDNNKGVLEVIGNGRYSIEVRLDETGDIIHFPDPYRDIHPEDTEDIEFTHTLKYTDILNVVDTVKTSLATTMENPVLTNYFVGDFVCATDTLNIAAYKKNLLGDSELVLSPVVIDLMTLLSAEDINVKIGDDYILGVTDDAIVYSNIFEDDVADYPIDAIESYIKQDFDNSCTINRQKLLALLDRISLFVSSYDENVVDLTFTANDLKVATNNSGSDEALKYEDADTSVDEFSCKIDVVALITHLKSCISDNVDIGYGADNSIRITDGNVVKVLALSTDE